MHQRKSILAIIVSLGLALALLLPLSITGANGPLVGIDAPAEVEAGSPFVANVTVDWVTRYDSCGFDVTYDQTVITVTDVTGGVIGGYAIDVEGWTYVPADPHDPGRIRVVTLSSVPLVCVNGTGYLAQIHFDAVGSGGDSSVINPGNVTMYDCDAVFIATTTIGSSVDITGPPPPPVGGTAHPISKVAIVALWIAVGAAIIVGTSLLVRRRRRAMR